MKESGEEIMEGEPEMEKSEEEIMEGKVEMEESDEETMDNEPEMEESEEETNEEKQQKEESEEETINGEPEMEESEEETNEEQPEIEESEEETMEDKSEMEESDTEEVDDIEEVPRTGAEPRTLSYEGGENYEDDLAIAEELDDQVAVEAIVTEAKTIEDPAQYPAAIPPPAFWLWPSNNVFQPWFRTILGNSIENQPMQQERKEKTFVKSA
jgi:hypothetical protein